MVSGVWTVATAAGGVREPGPVGVTQMSVRRIKICLMTGLCAGLLMVSASAQAQHHKRGSSGDCCDPCAAGAVAGGAGVVGAGAGAGGAAGSGAASGPCWVTQKVQVTEMVPTMVDQTVTVMQQQQRNETYTAYKTEIVPQTVTKQVTVNKMITETVNETRTVTERVPVQKQVTVMERVPVQKQVTVMERVSVQKQVTVNEKVPVQKQVTVMERVPVQKQITVNEVRYRNVMVTENVQKTVSHKVSVPTCVDLGPTLHDRLKKIHDPCYEPCPRTATVCKKEKVCETVCEQKTVCKKVAECVPVCKTVCTYECRPVCKTICTYECRPVTKTVCVKECVPVCKTVCAYECKPVCKTVAQQVREKQVTCPVTRTRCVPTCETVTCTRTHQVRGLPGHPLRERVRAGSADREGLQWSRRWSRRRSGVAGPCPGGLRPSGGPYGPAAATARGNPAPTTARRLAARSPEGPLRQQEGQGLLPIRVPLRPSPAPPRAAASDSGSVLTARTPSVRSSLPARVIDPGRAFYFRFVISD